MSEFYLITGALLMSVALVLAFRNATGGAVAAYAGVWSLRAAGHAPASAGSLLLWAAAVTLVVVIDMARPNLPTAIPARARNFIVGGSLAGMAAGLAFHQAGAILGSAAGAALGAVAFSRVSQMRHFPTLGRWTVATGLPTVVIMSLIALGIQGILATAAK